MKEKRKKLMEDNQSLRDAVSKLQHEVLEKNPELVGLRQVMEHRLTVWLDDRLDGRLTQRSEEMATLISTLRSDKAITNNLKKFHDMLMRVEGMVTHIEQSEEKLKQLMWQMSRSAKRRIHKSPERTYRSPEGTYRRVYADDAPKRRKK